MADRTPEDYGVPDLDDATLRLLASDPKKYGEKSRFAARELAARQRVVGESDQYRAALERAAYGDAGREYGAGLGRVQNYLAGAGPLADSGAALALRSRLYSDTYGRAQGRIGQSYADYLGQALAEKRRNSYQRAMQAAANKKKKGALGAIGGAIGAVGGALIGGPAGAVAGYGAGSSLGGGGSYQANDAYYG